MGADFSAPITDGGITPGQQRTSYDLQSFTGVAFWAMASAGTDPSVRLKMVMRASTQIQDGGSCDESFLGSGSVW